MERYKICPICGTKNPPTMIECINCETDLTGVSIGESAKEFDIETVSKQEADSMQSSTVKMVRVCECGAKNLVSARKCLKCGEDISDIIPVQDTESDNQEKLHYIFSSLDGDYAYELSTNLTIIGRENEMKDYLASKAFVSRKHAELLIEVDKLWIKNYSNTNHTFVNDVMIKDNEYVELHDGDIIGLGGKNVNGSLQDQAAYFLVRIGTCI